MNNKTFQNILHKTGEKFLKYILNFEGEILVNRSSDDKLVSVLYGFNKNQIYTLENLNDYIRQCETWSSQNPNSKLKQYLFNNGILFNEWRKNCGGEIVTRESKNKLLNYLFSKSVEYYPSLLIADIQTLPFYDYNKFNLLDSEYKLIYNLLKKDAFLSKILVDEHEKIELNKIQCTFENSFIINCYLFNFVDNFLLRSFQNCCYRTKYDLKDFLDDIESQYGNLEKIANNEIIHFSYFSGIYGLRLDGIDEFKLSDNVKIRNINETNNPCIKNTTSQNLDKILGCTLEYETQTKSIGKSLQTDESRTILDNFQLATILALQTIYPPFNFTFLNNSIPFTYILPRYINNNSIATILSNEQLELIKEWYEILNQTDLNIIDLTLHRIKSAIFNTDPINSILDAFIAWESMFSSKINTTKSVTKSIKKMLGRDDGYKISDNRLDDLYDLRSKIVHGNPNEHKLIKSKNLQKPLYEQEEVKKQVIEIGLIVLKQLIKDKELINKTPTERVEYLFNPTIDICTECKSRKLKFKE